MKSLFDKRGADNNKSALSIFPSFDLEKDLIKKGHLIIGGIDEAGRGSLAGPLSVAMVIFSVDFITQPFDEKNLINDSKKLSLKGRIAALEYIEEKSSSHNHVFISHEIIDKININRATELAIVELYDQADIKPDILLMDGNFKFNLPVQYLSIKKGDSSSISIAAASIVAKVIRDQYMEKIDETYPVYGFQKHKGYGTAIHRKAIAEKGYCDIHRKSYEPVKSMVLSEKGLDNRLFDHEGYSK